MGIHRNIKKKIKIDDDKKRIEMIKHSFEIILNYLQNRTPMIKLIDKRFFIIDDYIRSYQVFLSFY